MRRLFLFAAALALLLAFGLPAPAAAQDLPPLRLITSARFEHVATDGGRIVVVGQGYKESRERFYLTAQNFVTGNTTEVVLYDGRAWTRVNDEREWRPASVGAVRALVPTADQLLLFDGPLASLGPAQISGAATEHYQIWGDSVTSDPAKLGFTKVDFYVGVQDRHLYQFVIERTVERRDGPGTRQLAVTVRFFDHDDPALKVTPPL